MSLAANDISNLQRHRVMRFWRHTSRFLSILCLSDYLALRKLEVKQKTAEKKAMEEHRHMEVEMRLREQYVPSVHTVIRWSYT